MLEWLIPAASTSAEEIDWLFTLIFYTVGFWFLVAQGIFFGFILKFRRRPGVRSQYIAGESTDEKRWISWPHYVVIACDVVLIAGAIAVWRDVKQIIPTPDETIRVVAQQWAWTFVHPGPDHRLDTPDDVVTVNELHVRNDATYVFELSSRDVVHSFSVPVFRLKQDAVPGRVITGWFRPTRTGTFDIACAEMCGIGHALMPAVLHVESAEAHAAWLGDRTTVAAASSESRS
ncbi:MAG: cytochrome c oxidase subunit II [Deltaproteobacteria bacterium]|nr:cytochrome c oxidase subunit II [Deltaproteobacteria bacterium]